MSELVTPEEARRQADYLRSNEKPWNMDYRIRHETARYLDSLAAQLEAAQELREGEALVSDATRRVFASKHECSPKASKLGRELIDALAASQEKERQLRDALEQIEQLDRMGHNSEVAAEMGYIARVTLDSTQTHGGSDD